MKVLIATRKGQGIRSTDFSHTKEGELVVFTMECDGEQIDGVCGCRRSMAGMKSMRATTTFEVADIAIKRHEFYSEIKTYWKKAGWMKHLSNADVKKTGRELLLIASDFSTGTVLEKRASRIMPRMII